MKSDMKEHYMNLPTNGNHRHHFNRDFLMERQKGYEYLKILEKLTITLRYTTVGRAPLDE
jgi:hypothetical protein